MPFRVFLAISALLLASGFDIQPQDGERQRLNAWFDSLGFDCFKNGEFVEVKTRSRGGRYVQVDYGFLLEGSGTKFKIRDLHLDKVSYDAEASKKAPFYARDDVSTFQPVDLHAWLRNELRQLSSNPVAEGYYGCGWAGWPAHYFVLARLADLRGEKEVADAFYKKATTDPYHFYPDDELSGGTLQGKIAFGLLRHATGMASGYGIPRQDALNEFQFILDHFPDCPPRKAAGSAASILREMIAMARTHPAISMDEIKKLPLDKRIAELIYGLQDQIGEQNSQPGYVDVFMYVRDSPTPAGELRKIGFDAVPQLLNALQDKRFIRCMQGGMHNINPQVLRVRDAAGQILDALSGGVIRQSGNWSDVADEKEAATTEKAARAWWSEVQRKGIRAVLNQSVRKGDYVAAERAAKLVELYPSDAVASIRVGVAKDTGGRCAVTLIAALRPLRSHETLQYARTEMVGGTTLVARVAAAGVVAETHPEEAVDAMIAEWSRISKKSGDSEDTPALVQFLVASRRPRAIKALTRGLSSMTVRNRNNVIYGLDRCFWDTFEGLTFSSTNAKVPPADEVACQDAAERALVAELKDLSFTDTGGWMSPITIQDPRLCDLATCALSQLWPKKYKFVPEATEFARDLQRLQALNVWKAARGEALLPVPRPRDIGKPPAALSEWINQASQDSSLAQAHAMRNLERAGLVALPEVERAVAKLSPGKARDRLEALAVGLASTVRSVRFAHAPGSASAILEQIKGFEGQTLTADRLTSFLQALIDRWPQSISGIGLKLLRDADGCGIELVVDFADRPHNMSAGDSTDYEEYATLDGEDLASGSGGWGKDYRSSGAVTEFGPFLEGCLASRPSSTFSIHILIAPEHPAPKKGGQR
jgi:hypothetical protein